MGGLGAVTVEWGEVFFQKAFAEAWQCISAVTAHQKSLAACFADALPPNQQITRGTEPKKFGETRYE